MNKKVLSAILFGALFAGTGTFTSCIDNEEPAGIEELRGAKAELIRAKVAVEAANATFKLAEAELVKAQAAVQNAIAQQEKALAEYQELVNERQSITNAEAQADLDAKIAAAELAAEEAQLNHEIAMTNLTKKLAEAKRGYEVVMAEIEIAKATLSGKERVTIYELQAAVEAAQNEVEKAEGEVAAAEKDYYNATLDVKYGEVDLKRAETKVANAEAALALAQETYDMWNGFLSEDAETADWTAEITALEDSIKLLEKKQVELTLEEAKIKNSEEYRTLVANVAATKSAYNNHKTGAKYETKKSFTSTWSDNAAVAKGTKVESYVKAGDAEEYVKGALEQIAGANWDGKGGFIKKYTDLIAGYTTEKQALLDEVAAKTEDEVKADKKTYEEKVKAWKDATAAYKDAMANAKNISSASIYNKADDGTETGAFVVFQNEVEEAGELTGDAKAKALLKAEQAFADALVAFYNTVPADQAAMNNISLELKINGRDVLETRSIKAWLTGADRDVYLNAIYHYFNPTLSTPGLEVAPTVNYTDVNKWKKFWSKTNDTKEAITNGKVTTKATGAYSSWLTQTELQTAKYNALVAASTAAFGEASLYAEMDGTNSELNSQENGYMHAEPTQAELKAVGYSNAGAAGAYYASQDAEYKYEAKNYKEIIAYYEEAKTYWTETATALIAENKELKAAYTAASNSLSAKDYEIYVAVTVANGNINEVINALTNVKKALTTAVTNYLKVDFTGYNGTVKFETWLKGQVEAALLNVYDAEESLIYAQNNLTAIQDGKVGVFEQLTSTEEALAEAMAELEAAQAELDAALANLAKGLEIIAATNAE